MNEVTKERIQELASHAGQEEFLENFAKSIIRECAKWMSDGNIPDGFWEATRLLEHFGIKDE